MLQRLVEDTSSKSRAVELSTTQMSLAARKVTLQLLLINETSLEDSI